MEQNQDRPNPGQEEREDQDFNKREVDPNNPTANPAADPKAEQDRRRQNEDIGGRESNANDPERESDGRFVEEEDYDQHSSTGSGYSSSRKGSL
jgi:hypothetical protein